MSPEGIATASGIDIDLVTEGRQEKYIVDDESGRKEDKVAEVQPVDAGRPLEGNIQSKVSDKRHEAKAHGKQIQRGHKEGLGDPLKEDLAKVDVAQEKRQFKKVERVLSADDKDESPRRKISHKDKRRAGSHSNSPFDKVLLMHVWCYLFVPILVFFIRYLMRGFGLKVS